MNEKNSKLQIGFQENCRTSDHILTVKTLIDKYNQNGKKLYTCFIDFRKAFDSVWRNALFYKLLKNDIGGTFGRMIQNIYHDSKIQIKLQGGLTETFSDNVGVKQGCVLSPTLFKIFIKDLPDIFDEKCKPITLHKESLNCLLFVDDVIIMSETAEGLQRCLDRLKVYSDQWLLHINTDKTKVMIFNKPGKLIKGQYSIGLDTIDTVNSYTYLGIVFRTSGNFSDAMNMLSQKASKAMFKLSHSLYQLNLPPSTSCYLFDTLVRPISTYGCETWGAFLGTKDKVFNINHEKYSLFDEPCFEKLDIKFSKTVLGVHRKSSNAAVRGELGRYPTTLYILKQVVKNWLRIVNYDFDTVLYDAYLCNLQMVSENKSCWLSHIKNFIKCRLGLTHLWDNQGHTSRTKAQANKVETHMKHIFEFQWLNELSRNIHLGYGEGNKLRTYYKFKREFEYEKYLDTESDFFKRRNITKFRISSHRLEIEIGRYACKGKREKIGKDKRLCKNCDMQKIEDEEHVLMLCPKYQQPRQYMLDSLIDTFLGLKDLNDAERFIFIMKCCDYESTNLLSKMLDQVSLLRGTL